MKWFTRYRKQTGYMLFVALPLSIVGFTLSTVWISLGLALSLLWIGLPLLRAGLRFSHAFMRSDLSLQRGLLSPAQLETIPLAPDVPGEIRYRDMFSQPALYTPLLYWLLKLPVAVLQFSLALIFPLCGLAITLSPLVYYVLNQYGIPAFQDEVFFNVLLPMLDPFERSWVASGIGFVMVLSGIGLLGEVALGGNRWLGALAAGTETNSEAPAATPAESWPHTDTPLPNA